MTTFTASAFSRNCVLETGQTDLAMQRRYHMHSLGPGPIDESNFEGHFCRSAGQSNAPATPPSASSEASMRASRYRRRHPRSSAPAATTLASAQAATTSLGIGPSAMPSSVWTPSSLITSRAALHARDRWPIRRVRVAVVLARALRHDAVGRNLQDAIRVERSLDDGLLPGTKGLGHPADVVGLKRRARPVVAALELEP